MNQLLVIQYDGNSNNSSNEIDLKKCLATIKKKNNKTPKIFIVLYVACFLFFIDIFFEKIYSLQQVLDIFMVFVISLIALARKIIFKRGVENYCNIYNKHKKFSLTFYDTFLEFNVDNKLIRKISYSKFNELYGTKDMFLINSVCCIYKNCVDTNVINEIENILMDKLGDRYKQLDIK